MFDGPDILEKLCSEDLLSRDAEKLEAAFLEMTEIAGDVLLGNRGQSMDSIRNALRTAESGR